MPKLPECDRCLLFARNPYLVCAVHPKGPNADTCPNFRDNPNAEPDELWELEGASYYNGELILQPRQRWTPEQRLELLDTHPLFTGRCPRCEMTYPQQDLRRHTIYSVAKKGDRVFKLLSVRPHLKILTEQKITDSPVKQVLNVALGI